jgi:hypothetical protein
MPFFESIHDGKKFLIVNLIVNLGRREFTKMDVDRMKKIVFPCVGVQCLMKNLKCLFPRQKISQDLHVSRLGSCEKNLQRLEGIFCFNSP